VILSIILQLLTVTITDSNAELISLANSVLLFLLFPICFLLYFWTGMRAAKNYGFDAVGAATVAAFAYFVTGFVERILNMILSIIIVSRPLGEGGFGTTEMIIVSSVLDSVGGLRGVAFSAVCGLGIIIIGTMLNFVVGGFGALFSLRRSR
jgi:hypothetical protein